MVKKWLGTDSTEAGSIEAKEVAPMLRIRRDQPSLWESVLPEEVLRLSEELAKVDALLEDERFIVLGGRFFYLF